MENGLKEALAYAVGLAEPHIVDYAGGRFTDKQLSRIECDVRASAIHMKTLTGLVDYIKMMQADTLRYDQWIVQVNSPFEVSFYSKLNEDRKREALAVAEAELPSIRYNSFTEAEDFLIALRSMFVQTEATDLLLKFAGTVEIGSVQQYSDDGISQKATVKQGISGKEEAIVPSPIALAPFRTFMEIEQPESEFIFRMKSDDRSVFCALFEADGGAWKNEAMQSIKQYLEEQLKDIDFVTVIA